MLKTGKFEATIPEKIEELYELVRSQRMEE